MASVYSSDWGHDDLAILILQYPRFTDNFGSILYGIAKDSLDILHTEGNIFNAITMLAQMLIKFFLARIQWRLEDEKDFALLEDAATVLTVTSFKARIGDFLETETSYIVGWRLLGIADPKNNVIKTIEFSKVWPRSLIRIACL